MFIKFLLHKISKQKHSCTLNPFVCQTKMSKQILLATDQKELACKQTKSPDIRVAKKRKGEACSWGSCCFCYIWPISVLVNPAHILLVCAEICFNFCAHCCQERKKCLQEGTTACCSCTSTIRTYELSIFQSGHNCTHSFPRYSH